MIIKFTYWNTFCLFCEEKKRENLINSQIYKEKESFLKSFG